jgi:dTDP-4-amino-4,6-dideoxygalactose transaminase
VQLFKPNSYTSEWLKELRKTFDSGMLAQAERVEEFEQRFSEVFSFDYSVALNSCTAALEMAYHLCGIKKGSKVLTPVLTCSATNIPLVHRGANIEFVDINKKTMCMDYLDFAQKVDKQTKAIVVVNLGGHSVDYRIYDIARDFNIPVIVDAAQSLGVREPEGNYVCYSFQAIKHFTTADGGMICVRNEKDYERAKNLRWFGIDRDRRRKMNFEFSPSDREMCMNMDEPGFKTHMNDVQATLGLVGLKHTHQALEHRTKIAGTYLERFGDKIQCISGGSHWLFAIMLDDRDKKTDYIKEQGVQCDLVHLRNDIFTPFGGKRQELPNMDEIETKYLYIPIHNKMSITDAKYVSKVILEVI